MPSDPPPVALPGATTQEDVDFASAKVRAKAQFETLGRYVQAFEAMVREMRNGIAWLTPSHDLGNHLVKAMINHRVMTAQPILDIYRVVCSTILQSNLCTLQAPERNDAFLVLNDIFKRAKSAIENRNDIVHGTWFISWQSSAHSAEEDYVRTSKGVLTGKALEYRSPISTRAELQDHIRECGRLNDLIFRLTFGITSPVPDFREEFWRDANGGWVARPIAK